MLDETSNAEFPSLAQQPNNFAFNNYSSIPQSTVLEANGLPIINPFATSDTLINSTASIPQVVPSISFDQFRGETSHDERGMFLLQPEDTLAFRNPEAPLPVWPAPQVPYACSCCQVLREITHTKGNYVTKLDIHGRLGFICHAVVVNRFVSGDWTTQSQYYQMIDFSKKSIEAVKEYLVQYCQGRQQEGYTMQKDPLLPFYEALCVGLTNEDHGTLETDQFIQPSWENSGDQNQVNQPEPLNQIGARRDEVRLSLAEQRFEVRKAKSSGLMGSSATEAIPAMQEIFLEFRAGKMTMEGKRVVPDPRRGLVRMGRGEEGLVHFQWHDRTHNFVEDDQIVFPEEAVFEKVTQASGRVYILKFNTDDRKFFFWMQEPDPEGDSQLCDSVNFYINRPSEFLGEEEPNASVPLQTSEDMADEDILSRAGNLVGPSMGTEVTSDS